MRAQILIRKVSARAFTPRPDKKGEAAGEVGIEGTTIEAADEVPTTPNIPCPHISALMHNQRLTRVNACTMASIHLARVVAVSNLFQYV